MDLIEELLSYFKGGLPDFFENELVRPEKKEEDEKRERLRVTTQRCKDGACCVFNTLYDRQFKFGPHREYGFKCLHTCRLFGVRGGCHDSEPLVAKQVAMSQSSLDFASRHRWGRKLEFMNIKKRHMGSCSKCKKGRACPKLARQKRGLKHRRFYRRKTPYKRRA